jgi:protein tyrosine/serine phosphatase
MEAGDIKAGQVALALRTIRDAKGPILIHCWHGADRTGLISAMYRIVFQGWSKEDAIEELVNGGYRYHSIYRNIREFVRDADIESIKRMIDQS